jgi:Fe-S-cluster containining protein
MRQSRIRRNRKRIRARGSDPCHARPTMAGPEIVVITLDINTRDGRLKTAVPVPKEPIRLSDLARSALSLDDQLVKLSVKKHAPGPSAVSCRKGCASCCYQAIPLSPPEVFLLYDIVEVMPEARQEQVLARFVEAEEQLEGKGFHERFEVVTTTEELGELAAAYFKLGLPCPFLEGKVCSIYDSRPASCREYLVTTPAQHCAEIGTKPIRSMPMSIRMSEALCRVAARVLDIAPALIPLTLAMAWAHEHEEERQRRWDAEELLKMLFEELGRTNGG